VQACNAGGCSAFSATGTVSVVHPPASAPTLSGPSSSNTGTFTLTWTAVTGATSYHLHQTVNGSNTLIYASSGRSWSSSALGNGSYAYQVYACNAGGCGPVSNTVTVSVLHIPASPAWVTAPSNATLSTPFTVSWAASSGATSYTLRQTDTDNGNVTTKYTGSARSASVTVGLPGFYQYAVKACNSAGCSGWRNAPNLTDVERSGPIRVAPESEPASAGSSL
jgi:hypothetical protein